MGLGLATGLFLSWIVPLQAAAEAQSSANPGDVRFEVRLKTGAVEFRVGELIPLELLFASNSSRKYQVDTSRARDSFGPEKFNVKPEVGWTDPLPAYFRSRMSGGLAPISATPSSVLLELNEWVQFDRPGKYQLRVDTSRVSEIDPGLVKPVKLPLSEPLEIRIVPATAAWQERTLREALVALDKPAVERMRESERTKAAIANLRYLGTPAAAREMARRLRGDRLTDRPFLLGLIGSPARGAAIDELERLFADPDFPVTRHFVTALSEVSLADAPPRALDERRTEREDSGRRLLEVLPLKRGEASLVSLMTALELTNRHAGASPELLGKAVALFDRLAAHDQRNLLEHRWDEIKGPGMLPLLRRLAQAPKPDPDRPRRPDDQERAWVSAVALRRWYETEPEHARPAVIHEIVQPSPRFGVDTLGILADKTLPEADAALAENLTLGEDIGRVAPLIHRYATAALVPEVVGVLDARVGSTCAPSALLAYLLRVDPALAEPRIEAALAARNERVAHCYRGLLGEIGKLQTDPLLSEIAARSLEDSDPQVAANAAALLEMQGTAAAEAKLWERYVEWSEVWRGRDAELRDVPGESNPALDSERLGLALARALVRGPGWLADEAKLQRVLQLAVGATMRRTAEWALTRWRNQPWWLHYDGNGRFRLLEYRLNSLDALKQKLEQFPRGSSFVWRASDPRSSAAELEGLRSEIQTLLSDLGMQLSDPPAPTDER